MPSEYKQYSEDEIVRGCVRNDRRCQELLYRQHFDVMYGMIRRYTNDEERALDILNAGFLKVFKKIDTYSGEGSLQGWIRRIVFHCLSDHFKKDSRYLKFIVLDEVEKTHATSALDKLYYEDLLEAVETIPGKGKTVFQLYAIEGYSHKEIAEILTIPEGTSKWYLSKAREHLKNIIYSQMKTNYAG